MPSASHLTWQLVLYGAIALTYLGVATTLLDAPTTLRKWLAGSYLVVFSENVVALPMALCGYDPYDWLLGHPQTTQYLGLVLTSMWVTLAAVLVFTRNPRLPRLLNGLPPFLQSESRIRQISLLVSLVCALMSFVLSAGGYSGYYLANEYFYKPTPWRDIVSSIVNTGALINFVLLLFCCVRYGRIRGPEWALILLWTAAGLASGFKSEVVFPPFCAFVAAWLTNRLGIRHLALFAIAVVLAYGVIEPMRQRRWNAGHDNGVRGLYDLTTSEGLTLPKLDDVALAFLARLDSAETAVDALEADQFGQINGYRQMLRDTYRYLPALAFVPRMVWPDKPLANQGGVLSAELYGAPTSAVTPSTVVDSYLWAGYIGLVLNSVITAYFLVLAGLLLAKYMRQPLCYLPALLLVAILAMPTPIKAFHYIMILRALVGVALFYAFARRFGLVRDDRRAASSVRPVPGVQSRSMPGR